MSQESAAMAVALDAPSVNTAILSERAKDAARAGTEYLSRAVYTTCYCTSYGIAFPIVFLSHIIPGGVPLAAGIADGARAAKVYVRGLQLAQKRVHRHESSETE